MAQRRSYLRGMEENILDKQLTGKKYIDDSRVTELVEAFSLQVRNSNPDVILFINDPGAPGGMELRRRMAPIMKARGMAIRAETLRVEGQSGSRNHNRGVTSSLDEIDLSEARRILILDAIAFSGNTLRLAREAIRSRCPNAIVELGVLVLAQPLLEKQGSVGDTEPARIDFHQTVTDRQEVFFPWGVTQTTAVCEQRFEGATPGSEHCISIAKRPWGTIEVLAEQEVVSVRQLTIEAGRKLSFQRHLCRDEMFVALDDNVGLDICAEELEAGTTEYDERVKSLVLEKGDYVLVPRGMWHRTKAAMDRVRLLEVAFGLYDQDHDIERRWDDYERQQRNGSI